MVKLKLKVDPKGRIVLPKFIREKIGIKPHSYVIADFKEDGLTLQRELDIDEFIDWLKKSRKLITRFVSKVSLEDEVLENLL